MSLLLKVLTLLGTWAPHPWSLRSPAQPKGKEKAGWGGAPVCGHHRHWQGTDWTSHNCRLQALERLKGFMLAEPQPPNQPFISSKPHSYLRRELSGSPQQCSGTIPGSVLEDNPLQGPRCGAGIWTRVVADTATCKTKMSVILSLHPT